MLCFRLKLTTRVRSVGHLGFGGSHFENAHIFNIAWTIEFRIAYDLDIAKMFVPYVQISEIYTVSRPS